MLKTLALVACACAIPGIAHAANAITYDCDTAAGHFSELVLPSPGSHFVVTGNIKVNNIAKDKKWAPIVRLRIGSAPAAPGAAPSGYAGFELAAMAGKEVSMAAETVQAFSFDVSGKDEEIIPTSLQPAGTAEPFRLSFDGSSVAIDVHGQSRSYPVAADPAVVQVICSTGEFLITDLRIQPLN
jgi:hypothetical protein